MGELQIGDVIRPSCVNLHMKASNKEEVIREMTGMLYEAGMISSQEDCIRDVYLREAEGATGLGDGVAIPHGKSDAVIRTSVAIGRCTQDIEWETIGEGPSRLFIMFAVNNQDKSKLVSLLAQVAVALCDETVVERLFRCEEAGEAIALLSKKDAAEVSRDTPEV